MSNNTAEAVKPIVSTSVHLEPADVQQLDKLAAQWRVSRSAAVRKLVKASEDYETLKVIEGAAYRRPATLPEAHRYKFVADFSVMIGVENLSFRRGQIITRDGHSPQFISDLFARGAAIEPLPD